MPSLVSSGLRGAFKTRRHDASWQQRINRLKSARDKITRHILILGPRPESEAADKRKAIRLFLESNRSNTVCFPEDFEYTVLFPGIESHQFVEMLLPQADVIIAIVPKELALTGVRAELLKFADEADFQDKVLVIAPKAERTRRGLLTEGLKLIHCDNVWEYTDGEYEDCHRIRDWCEKRVEKNRTLEFRDRLRQASS
jgi:hypothetical protein